MRQTKQELKNIKIRWNEFGLRRKKIRTRWVFEPSTSRVSGNVSRDPHYQRWYWLSYESRLIPKNFWLDQWFDGFHRIHRHHGGISNRVPKSIDFQIIIEIPDDEYETRGFKFINYNLSELLENGLFTDIKFIFKDEHIAAHSVIIAASSPVFAAMFEGERFKEGQTRTVNVEDIDSRVFRKLLQFLYSGISTKDPSDVLQALYSAADKYQVDALKEICEEFLIFNWPWRTHFII